MPSHRKSLTTRVAIVALLAGIVIAGCGSSKSSNAAPSSAAGGNSAAGGQVLPVTKNPINNTSTVQALKIAKVTVENNVDASGTSVSDHLELALKNTGTTPLTGFEVFYTVTDTKTNASESYYTKLPASFTIAPGATRTAQFDNTGKPDHFPINKFGLETTSKDALSFTIVVSPSNVAQQTASAKKAAGGGEVVGQ